MAKFRIRKYVSPVFLVLLFISLVMWYLTKLSYNYTAEVPVRVDIEGNKFTVTCVAEGAGYRILTQRLLKQNDIKLRFNEIQTTPSVINHGSYVINPYSLQNAISVRNSDIRIISVGNVPEITIRSN